MPVSEWPKRDRDAWQQAAKPESVSEDGGPAWKWRSATRSAREKAYGRYLAFLSRSGVLNPETTPKDRVAPERVAAFVELLRSQTASSSVWSMIANFDAMVRALAPDGDWAWLRSMANRLKRMKTPARAIRPRLQGAHRTYRAGITQMIEAQESAGGSPSRRAARFRDGLLLALQSARALRLKNLSSIMAGENLIASASGYVLRFCGEQMKNGRPYECAIPDQLAPYVTSYLEVYRPVLLRGGASKAFWITRYGWPMDRDSIGVRVAKTTKRIFGVSMSTHLFRHDLATTIAIQDPEHVRISTALLAHSTFATTDRYYILAHGLRASRVHGSVISCLRESLSPSRKPGLS